MQTMSLLVAATLSTGLPLVAAIIWSGRRAISAERHSLSHDWLEELSPDRYQPMLRLLDRQDLDFLRSQPGFTRKIERSFRRKRYQLFRSYLEQLDGDFQKVCAALKIVMVQAREDRPDLAAILFRQQARFGVGMLAVHFQMMLYRCGIGTVQVGVLLKVFDGVRLELRSLVPASAALGA